MLQRRRHRVLCGGLLGLRRVPGLPRAAGPHAVVLGLHSVQWLRPPAAPRISTARARAGSIAPTRRRRPRRGRRRPSGGHPSGSNWIEHNGMRRNFQMGPTTCTSPPCPLVLVMHGWTMSTANMVSSTQMNSRVSAQGRGGAVVVYPDGTGSGIQKCWRVQNAQPLGGCSNPAIDDVGYIAALIDLMISRYNVDMNRVYAMGFSNGGTMTLQLACFLNWKITAFGIVGAGPLTGEGGSHRFVDTSGSARTPTVASPQAVSL